VQVDRHRVAQRLRRVAGTLGMGHELTHVGARSGAHDRERDRHFLEIGWGVVDIVLLRVSEGCPNVSRGVLDGDLVEWREPRQLGQQSKRRPHHQVLERRRSLVGAATRQRLVGLDDELSHPSLEVDVAQDPRHRPGRGSPLLRRFGAHFLSQAEDLGHLLVEIDAALRRLRLIHDAHLNADPRTSTPSPPWAPFLSTMVVRWLGK
jgi:hypothetical protein